MDNHHDFETVVMHSALCVKLEPFDEDDDCTQNLDPLECDGNVHTKVELLQDFKTEIETDCSDQHELIQEDILKNNLSDTATKIEEINIKTEYTGNEASALDDVRESRGIIEDDIIVNNQNAGYSRSRHAEQACVEVHTQTGEDNSTSYEPSHLCEFQRYDQKLHVCEICKKEFRHSSSLTKHKLIHTGQKPYDCDVCKKKFRQSSSLVAHKLIHTGHKPYVCDICQKSFSRAGNLATHTLIHTDHKPYVCEVCKKEFRHSHNLTAHKRIHTGQKPHVCEICEKAFSRASHLARHKLTHSDQKPFACDICKKEFKHSPSLTKHKQVHIGQTRMFVQFK